METQTITLNKKVIIAFLTLFTFFSFSSQLIAQDITEFKGEVLNEYNKRALPLADILVVGTSISTVTNSDGEFLLKVPNEYLDNKITISYLGFETLEMPISKLKNENTKILLKEAATVLAQVDVNAPKDAESLVKKALSLRGENYVDEGSVMTTFYRETIKKRNKNASLSEAVLKVYKQPYSSNKKDDINLIKARKNTNYSRLDTLALKLQGGPFSTLYTDLIKYRSFLFSNADIDLYDFTFDRSTQINNKLVYVINFIQKEDITQPLYYGKIFIEAGSFAVTQAVYNLNVENKDEVSRMFVRKKPNRVKVNPTEAAYRVHYRTKNGKWYYSYSNILLTFKVNWKNKLFNSRYTLQSEMAVTDWNTNTAAFTSKNPSIIKPNTILEEKASGFSDPRFWGEYNIIEPEKSIESAIEKINKKLKKA